MADRPAGADALISYVSNGSVRSFTVVYSMERQRFINATVTVSDGCCLHFLFLTSGNRTPADVDQIWHVASLYLADSHEKVLHAEGLRDTRQPICDKLAGSELPRNYKQYKCV